MATEKRCVRCGHRDVDHTNYANGIACACWARISKPDEEPRRYCDCPAFISDTAGLHQTGAATCGVCGRRWQAVFPVEARELECPDCHSMTPTSEAFRA